MLGVSLDQQYTDQHILIYAAPARPDRLASVAVECLFLLPFKSQHGATQMNGIHFFNLTAKLYSYNNSQMHSTLDYIVIYQPTLGISMSHH